MIFIRRLSRLTRLILHILTGITLTIWYSREFHDGLPSEKFQSVKQRWLSQVCRILHIEILQHGDPLEAPGLYISNHISWIDIPLVGGRASVNFLSKDEIRSWPIIGWLTEKSGTLFIKRGNDGAARQALQDMHHTLDAGQHVLIFPEGTTTDGSVVKRFHPRLFAIAIEQEATIQPVAIRYRALDGQTSQALSFIDNASFLVNLWHVLGETGIQADIYFLPVISTVADQQRKTVAEQTRKQISDALNLS